MALDTNKMIAKVVESQRLLESAMAQFTEVDRMTTVDSYIMGHVRASQASLQSAVDFIAQCAAFKNASPADKKQPVKKALPPGEPENPPA